MNLKRVNIELTEREWCLYEGKCLKDLNVSNGLCLYCKYREELDIPEMIENSLKEYKK